MCIHYGSPEICKVCNRPKEEMVWKKPWKKEPKFYALGQRNIGLRKIEQLVLI